jgi:hypothetical protein
MRNFKETKDYDYDQHIKERHFVGRVTKNRIETINSFIETFNEQNMYPYGKGYSCGHIHDCCGCLVSNYMTAEIEKNKITIYWKQTYNY